MGNNNEFQKTPCTDECYVRISDLKQAILENPYDPAKGEISGYLRYLKYNTPFRTDAWIPCSERLPKINEYVLAVFDHKNGVIDSIPLVSCYRPEVVDTTELNENGEWVVTSRKNPFATIDGWYIREITDAPDGSLFRLWNCVAWRPLPEAYEGGTEDGATDL